MNKVRMSINSVQLGRNYILSNILASQNDRSICKKNTKKTAREQKRKKEWMKEKGKKILFQKSKQRNGKEKDDLLDGTYRRFTKKKRKKKKRKEKEPVIRSLPYLSISSCVSFHLHFVKFLLILLLLTNFLLWLYMFSDRNVSLISSEATIL